MTGKHILIIEDEESIGELIEFNLAKNGYKCTRTDAAEKALKMFDDGSRFDLILLDLMLTGMDGTEFCKIYRANKSYPQVPIIMLTARSEEADIVSGLDYGANDYITKPFSPRVLLARIRAQLRDASAATEDSGTVLSHDGIELNPEFHEVNSGQGFHARSHHKKPARRRLSRDRQGDRRVDCEPAQKTRQKVRADRNGARRGLQNASLTARQIPAAPTP